MNTNIESRPRISTSWNSLPLTPSTLSVKRVSGSLKRIELMLMPFLAGFFTMSRAVGVPRSVNTVSKFTVSREKASTSADEVVIPSSIHDTAIKPISPMSVIIKKRIVFIYAKNVREAVFISDEDIKARAAWSRHPN